MPHIVRYKLKADRVAENEAFVTKVFEELRQVAPKGLHYATFKLDDGVSFMHLVYRETPEGAPNQLTSLTSFKAFAAGVRDRCEEPPVTTEVKEIGSYAFLSG